MERTRGLLVTLALGALGCGWLLLAPDVAPAWVTGVVVVPVLLALPVVVLVRVHDAGGVRPWLVPLSAGMALFPLGVLVAELGRYVAPGTGGFLGHLVVMAGYPFLLAGLLAALVQHVRGLRLTMCLDGLAGAFAGAATATLAMSSLLAGLPGGSWTAAIPLAYPFLDGVVLSAALGGLAMVGLAHGRQYGLWTLGFLLLASAHMTEAQIVIATSTGPAPQDTALLVVPALGLLAVGALGHRTAHPERVPGARSLGVPAAASVVAIGVLSAAPSWGPSALLALAALGFSAVRFTRAFLQLRELAVVKEQALTDELTGIANRRALYEHLDSLLAADASGPSVPSDPQGEPAPFSVALVDLDHFKEVNDTFGHATGDALLKGVAARFAATLEELDTSHLLARLGGDEFAVVLHEAASRNAALIVGQALHESLAEPLALPDADLHAGASIGLALAPQHGRNRSDILFAADAAMYAAKASGDAVRFHAPSRDEKVQQLLLAEDLHRALERHELWVEYQPILSREDRIVGVEALVRWDHPRRGLLLPGEFLPAAERYRLTGAVAQRVLDIALADLARWRSHDTGLGLTVNLSTADLRDESVVSVVAEALLAHGLPADALTLDVGETGLGPDDERTETVLTALHELGVHLALDDYGTGTTSLTQLQQLPFGTIKLAGRFARDAAVDARSTGIVRATIDLAHSLGRVILAEGVEDRRALARLRELGCDLVQGRYVGAPASAREVEVRLARPTGGKHRRPALPTQPSHGPDEAQGATVTPA